MKNWKVMKVMGWAIFLALLVIAYRDAIGIAEGATVIALLFAAAGIFIRKIYPDILRLVRERSVSPTPKSAPTPKSGAQNSNENADAPKTMKVGAAPETSDDGVDFVSQWLTFAIGIATTSFFVSLFACVALGAVPGFPRWIFALGGCLIAVAVGVSGIRYIPVQHASLILLFGARTRYGLKEGFVWIVPWAMDLSIQDMRDRIRKLDGLKVFTKPTTKAEEEGMAALTVDGSITWRIENLFRYMSVQPDVVERGIDDMYDAALRGQAAESGLNHALGSSFKRETQGKIAEHVKEQTAKWGVGVKSVLIASVSPGEKVTEELEKKRREQGERDGEIISINHISARVSEIRQKHPDMSVRDALDVVELEHGKVKKEIIEHLWRADESSLRAAGEAAQGVVTAYVRNKNG